jgi:hypothetical protein
LQSLIAANKVGIRTVSDQVVFFSQGATRAEIVTALGTAGYAKASEMADALLDEHNLSIYSAEKITKMSSLFTVQLGKQPQLLERQSERPLTASEKTEARLVFGNSLNLDKIMLAEDPILSVGGYARTTPWTINFPPGSFGSANFMRWLIHELTHSWQYQHGVSLFTTIYYALTSDYNYGGEVGLRTAQAAGKKFIDFDTEQQGDILRDYYFRVKSGANVSAWQPFVNQVQSAP